MDAPEGALDGDEAVEPRAPNHHDGPEPMDPGELNQLAREFIVSAFMLLVVLSFFIRRFSLEACWYPHSLAAMDDDADLFHDEQEVRVTSRDLSNDPWTSSLLITPFV